MMLLKQGCSTILFCVPLNIQKVLKTSRKTTIMLIFEYHLDRSHVLLVRWSQVRAVVLNRGAVAHKGAVRQRQGCRQLSILLMFDLFQHLGVPIIIDLAKQGCREAKKVEKHWVRDILIYFLNISLLYFMFYLSSFWQFWSFGWAG